MLKEYFLCKIICLLLLCVPSLGCTNQGDIPSSTTIISILENESTYLGKKVIIKGYLKNHERNGLYIYRSEQDAKIRNHPASIYVNKQINYHNIDIALCSEKYIELHGTFGEYDPSASPSYYGLTEITTILSYDEETESFVPCATKLPL